MHVGIKVRTTVPLGPATTRSWAATSPPSGFHATLMTTLDLTYLVSV